MKGIVCFVVFNIFVGLSSAANVVCYLSSWSVYRQSFGKFEPKDIDPDLCSHIIFTFLGIGADGSVQILDSWEAIDLHGFSDLVALKQRNQNLKVLASIGGYNQGGYTFSTVLGNEYLRSRFVQNINTFLLQYGFDGIDISWEYPSSLADSRNFVSLVKELKNTLGNQRPVSISGAGLLSNVDLGYDVSSLSQIVDMINIMSYDYHGSYDHAVGHPSGLYASSLDQTVIAKTLNVNATVRHWLSKGANPSKLNVGIVTYGRGYTLADNTRTDLYSPITGDCQAGPYTATPGLLGYNEICELYGNWENVFDEEQKVPHIINRAQYQWVGYESLSSVKEKALFAKNLGLGGAAVWSLDTDDFRGACGGGSFPLIKMIKSVLS